MDAGGRRGILRWATLGSALGCCIGIGCETPPPTALLVLAATAPETCEAHCIAKVEVTLDGAAEPAASAPCGEELALGEFEVGASVVVQVALRGSDGALRYQGGTGNPWVAGAPFEIALSLAAPAPVVAGVGDAGRVLVLPGEGQLWVDGTGFGEGAGDSTLSLGEGPPLRVLAWSDTRIRAVRPPDAASGVLRVRACGVDADPASAAEWVPLEVGEIALPGCPGRLAGAVGEAATGGALALYECEDAGAPCGGHGTLARVNVDLCQVVDLAPVPGCPVAVDVGRVENNVFAATNQPNAVQAISQEDLAAGQAWTLEGPADLGTVAAMSVCFGGSLLAYVAELTETPCAFGEAASCVVGALWLHDPGKSAPARILPEIDVLDVHERYAVGGARATGAMVLAHFANDGRYDTWPLAGCAAPAVVWNARTWQGDGTGWRPGPLTVVACGGDTPKLVARDVETGVVREAPLEPGDKPGGVALDLANRTAVVWLRSPAQIAALDLASGIRWGAIDGAGKGGDIVRLPFADVFLLGGEEKGVLEVVRMGGGGVPCSRR